MYSYRSSVSSRLSTWHLTLCIFIKFSEGVYMYKYVTLQRRWWFSQQSQCHIGTSCNKTFKTHCYTYMNTTCHFWGWLTCKGTYSCFLFVCLFACLFACFLFVCFLFVCFFFSFPSVFYFLLKMIKLKYAIDYHIGRIRTISVY